MNRTKLSVSKSSGAIDLTLPLPPVSLQSKRRNKDRITESIRRAVAGAQFILTGDVSIAVEWRVSEQSRYEAGHTPDADNILKPMLDALSGPSGMIIDDCQVQHVSCLWLDPGEKEHFAVRIKFAPDEWLPKKNLMFLQVSDRLFIPVSGPANRRRVADFHAHLVERFAFRDAQMARGYTYFEVRGMMPIQRAFHVSRIQAFKPTRLVSFKTKKERPNKHCSRPVTPAIVAMVPNRKQSPARSRRADAPSG